MHPEIKNIRDTPDESDIGKDDIDLILQLRREISTLIVGMNKQLRDMEEDYKKMCSSRNYWFSAYHEQEMKLKYYELVLNKIANKEVEPYELARYAVFKRWGITR